jgi:hypothetical protein
MPARAASVHDARCRWVGIDIARRDEGAGKVDRSCTRGDRGLCGCSDGRDATTSNDDGQVPHRRPIRTVDQACAYQCDRLRAPGLSRAVGGLAAARGECERRSDDRGFAQPNEMPPFPYPGSRRSGLARV